jgi:hypothetical protein
MADDNSIDGGDEDRISMVPVYRFEWDDGRVRQTDDHDVLAKHVRDEGGWSGEAVEALAERGRADPSCEVTLLGMRS